MIAQHPRSRLLAAAALMTLLSACGPLKTLSTGEPMVSPSMVSANALRSASLDQRTRKFYEARHWKAA